VCGAGGTLPGRPLPPAWEKDHIGKQHAHGCSYGRSHAAADEEDTDQRTDRDFGQQYPGCPERYCAAERNADVRGVHQHGREQSDVVRGCEGEQDEELRRQPVAAVDGAVKMHSTKRLARGLASSLRRWNEGEGTSA